MFLYERNTLYGKFVTILINGRFYAILTRQLTELFGEWGKVEGHWNQIVRS